MHLRSTPPLCVALLALSCAVPAQDNVLVFGNSILNRNGIAPAFFADVVEQTGAPRLNVVCKLIGNGETKNYVLNTDLLDSSIPHLQDWKAMVVQGHTLETTTFTGYDVTEFYANMLVLAGALYPAWFPDPETWLLFPQIAYENARLANDAAFPNSPPMRIAKQGTCYANTTGYDIAMYDGDLHHLSADGQILSACLWYQEIYDARVCDIVVDFSVTTPLVTTLNTWGIDAAGWKRIAGYADRIQPRAERVRPGSDSDFQLRFAVNTGPEYLCPTAAAAVADTILIDMVSPLGAVASSAAYCLLQTVPTGSVPALAMIPGLYVDTNQAQTLYSVPDLTSASFMQAVPASLSGQSLWFQGVSLAPTGDPSLPFTLSDGKVIAVQ